MKAFRYFALAVGLVWLVTGCDSDVLDQVNPNARTTDSFWQTEDDAIKGTNAVYEPMTYEGMYMRTIWIVQDIPSDESFGDTGWDVILNSGNFTLKSTLASAEWPWRDIYHGVYRANQVLYYVPDITMDESLKARLLAEAKFLRGFYYLHLVKLFKNVPLITKPALGPDDYLVKQASPEETWQQIITDFKEAQAVLPKTYTADQAGRATWGAATAYLGYSYLYRGEIQAADAEFKKIVDSGLYSLVADPRDNMALTNENNSESIFEIQFEKSVGGTENGWSGTPQPNWGETQARSITWAPIGFGWADVEATPWLLSEFQKEKTVAGEDDPRLKATLFYNYPGATVYGVPFKQQYLGRDTTRIFWRKYESDVSGGNELDMRSGINFRVMRLADIYLMYAETQNELGNRSVAAQYVQKIRDRAGLPDKSSQLAGMTKESLLEEIAHQRVLEFAGEGKRWDDIKRWGWLNDPAKLNELKQHDPEFSQYTAGKDILPIPLSDMNVNPQLVQNPSY